MFLHESDPGQRAGCRVTPLDKPVSPQELARAQTVFLLVQGMGCPTCALRVRNGLLRIDGVMAADVLLSQGLAKVWYDPAVLQPESLPDRLPGTADDAGHHYTARLLEVFD